MAQEPYVPTYLQTYKKVPLINGHIYLSIDFKEAYMQCLKHFHIIDSWEDYATNFTDFNLIKNSKRLRIDAIAPSDAQIFGKRVFPYYLEDVLNMGIPLIEELKRFPLVL